MVLPSIGIAGSVDMADRIAHVLTCLANVEALLCRVKGLRPRSGHKLKKAGAQTFSPGCQESR